MSHNPDASANSTASSLGGNGHAQIHNQQTSRSTPPPAANSGLDQQQLPVEEILDAIQDRIYLKDLAGNMTFANKAFYESFGLTPEAVLGKHGDDFLPPEMQEICRLAEQKLHEQEKTLCVETHFTDANGKLHWSESHKSPLADSAGNITGMIGVGRDITQRKEADERFRQQETLLLHASRLSSLGQLVAEIVHEINQPCYSILNFAKAIENTFQREEQPDIDEIRKWCGQILSEATRMGEITKRLRTYVRRDATHRKPAQLNQIVRESIEFVAHEARLAEVAIEPSLTEGLTDLPVDRVQVQQVLVNLFKNAIEALQKDGKKSRQIIVSTQSVKQGQEIAVRDNGPGIPLEHQSRIFDPFHTTRREGVGLGLAISNTIMETHSGSLKFESQEGLGTTFRCMFANGSNQED